MTMNQKRIIVSTSAFACGLCLSIGQVHSNAQAPGEAAPATQAAPPTPPAAGGVAIEFSRDAGLGQGSLTISARKQADNYLTEHLSELENKGVKTKLASQAIRVSADDPNFDQFRRQAFETALLEAKAEMAKFLGSTVSSEVKQRVKKGNPQAELASKPASKSEAPSLLDKALKIVELKLDAELKKQGVDPNKGEKEQKEARDIADKIIRKEDFTNEVELLALNELSGMQSYRTFESCPKGKNGEIAVIAIQSPKSKQLQAALMGKGPPPLSDVKLSIRKWAQSEGSEVLLYTQGAQPRTNERGEVCLVGYGQCAAASEDGSDIDDARAQARLFAVAALRRFMGEVIAVQEKVDESSSISSFKSGAKDILADASFKKSVSAAGDALGMSGFDEVWDWEAVHPSSGKTVVGFVYQWSHSAMLEANQLREDMKAAGGASGGRGGLDLKPPTQSAKAPSAPASKGKASDGKGAAGEAP